MMKGRAFTPRDQKSYGVKNVKGVLLMLEDSVIFFSVHIAQKILEG